jgi:acetate kinase
MSGTLLVLNAGSATLKYQVLTMDARLAGATVEHIGEPGGPPDHTAAVQVALAEAARHDPVAVGHRVVHGGAELTTPVVIDSAVEAAIGRWSPLAPLHNPAALAGIRAARAAFADRPQVAVFDTAFHATLPAEAFTYAVDQGVAAQLGLRRYGFHGISVQFVVSRTAALLGRPVDSVNLIVLHLGNGASATAVHKGRSVDTSMGMTPLAGLVMGTRTGDIDPDATLALVRAGWSADAVSELYEHRSGLRGLCGDSDLRAVLERADDAAQLALSVYCHRLRHYIGAYLALLGRVDAIVFTAGVGENSAPVRSRTLAGLEPLGIQLDPNANQSGPAERRISTMESQVAVWVVPTDEERQIAAETARRLELPGWSTRRTP